MPKSKRPTFLMCRPSYYRIAYEINPWMRIQREVQQKRAQLQWEKLYQTLTKQLRVKVQLLRPKPTVPDLVFTANAGLIRDKTCIRSNFRFPERQREEPLIDQYFKGKKYRIITLPNKHSFEGEGDALWVRDTLLLGFRFRSDAHVHELLAKHLKARVLPLELVDKRFYHLDTCFSPISETQALWYPKAFDRYGRKVIEHLIPDPIAVTESDAKRFVCNAIVVNHSIVTQSGLSRPLARKLNRAGFELHGVDLSEFIKAGGSAKCLVLTL